jgi:hypothetical protein
MLLLRPVIGDLEILQDRQGVKCGTPCKGGDDGSVTFDAKVSKQTSEIMMNRAQLNSNNIT